VLAGHNILESLSFEVLVSGNQTEDFIGSIMQKMEKVLVKPGWSALKQVSLKVSIIASENFPELFHALRSLPDKYFSHLSKLESVVFNYSTYVDWC